MALTFCLLLADIGAGANGPEAVAELAAARCRVPGHAHGLLQGLRGALGQSETECKAADMLLKTALLCTGSPMPHRLTGYPLLTHTGVCRGSSAQLCGGRVLVDLRV